MFQFRKTICLVLALCLVMGIAAVPVSASEDPMAVKDYEEFGAAAPAVEETPAVQMPVQSQDPAAELPVQTEPEVQPAVEAEEPAAEETAPAETIPAATEVPTATEAPAAAEVPEGTEPPEETEPEEGVQEQEGTRTYDTVPLFFQTDYPKVRFGSGTLADNGCSITSLAMVASYMTGHEYLPDELARYFGGRAENNIARLEMGSDTLQLPYHKAQDWHETIAAIRDGKLVIALMGTPSPFTQSQHFIVITGMNEEGRILVNDSYRPNYDKWELKNGFINGFEEGDILCGFSGAWIYDVEAMPEEPFIYYVPEPVRPEPRYPGLELTEEEIELLARVVWVESRGESDEGQQAVAEVVFNRIASDRFADNLRDVIYGEGQFRSVPFLEDAEPYQTQYEAIENAIYGPYVLPEDVYYFATFPTTDKIWGEIGGHIFCYADEY